VICFPARSTQHGRGEDGDLGFVQGCEPFTPMQTTQDSREVILDLVQGVLDSEISLPILEKDRVAI
jgi:hypothetical protein